MWYALAGLSGWAMLVLWAIAFGKAASKQPPKRPTLQQLINTVWYDPDTHEWHRKDTK